MFDIENLNLKKLGIFKELNNRRDEFNYLNEDFFANYSKCNIFTKYSLRKQVSLLKYNDDYIGYIWASKYSSNQYKYLINSLFIDKNYLKDDCVILFNKLPRGSIALYECKENAENYNLLLGLGFSQDEGTYELIKDINCSEPLKTNETDIEFLKFRKGQDELIRCNLQNDIFSNVNREPLTIEDIIVDEMQEYYVGNWCIFLKYKGEYIGYGQIIKNSDIPTIVNFGIKANYRNKGFGDLFLIYLINLVYACNYNKVKIKVSTNNVVAYNLYQKRGFKVIEQYKFWIYNR